MNTTQPVVLTDEQIIPVPKEDIEYLWRVMDYYGNLTTYDAPRIGGVSAGCPRGELPTPRELVREALFAKDKLEAMYHGQPTPPVMGGRESLEDALEIVDSFGSVGSRLPRPSASTGRWLETGAGGADRRHGEGRKSLGIAGFQLAESCVSRHARSQSTIPRKNGAVNMTDEQIIAAFAEHVTTWREDGHNGAAIIDETEAVAIGREIIAALTGWRSMDSAPKDGKDVLVYTNQGLVRLAFFDIPRGGIWSSWPGRNEYQPVAWQPLPAPPSTPVSTGAVP